MANTKNPFNKGVTYEQFLSNVKGKVTIDSLLDKLDVSKEDKDWIKNELTNFKQK